MKALPLELTKDVVAVYDETKTTAEGRAALKTLTALQGGKTVVGSPLNVFSDTLTDALPTAFSGVRGCVSNNGHELLFNTSSATGVVICSLYDVNETTGVKTYVGKIQLTLPSTTHTQRFGRLVNDAGLTGWRILFGSIGTIPASGGLFSIENIDKADFVPGTPTIIPVASAPGQKAVYWHQETGGTNNLTVMQGGGHDHDAGLVTDKITIANGLVATPNFYVFDSSVAITTVGVGGVTTDWYTTPKTGVITGLTGVFLLFDNYSVCVPTADSGAPVAYHGVPCLFIPSSTVMGLAKLSDFTAGATSLPSYTTRDILDVPLTHIAIAPVTMHFSNTLQRVIFQTVSTVVIKKFVNAQYELVFGSSTNPQYRQTQPVAFYEFGAGVSVSTHEHGGWLHLMSNTAGQNGVIAFDLRSLWQQNFSRIISKVMNVPRTKFVSLSVQTVLRSFGKFWYKLSGFATPSTGWVEIPEDRDMTNIINSTGQIQIMIQTRMERDSVTIPIQIIESHLIIQPQDENDPAWRGDFRHTVSTTPAKTAFTQVDDYTGSKHWEFRAYARDTGALVVQSNTQDNPLDFELSVNDGSSFAALAGAIASSKLLNVLRYKWASPPGVVVDCSLREKV